MARDWQATSGKCRGDVSFNSLPDDVRMHIQRYREMGLPEGQGWEAVVFVDEPYGQNWRVTIDRDEMGLLEITAAKIVYSESTFDDT